MVKKVRFLRFSLGVVAAVLAIGGFAASPASAKPDKLRAAEQHCVVNVETGEAQCFATFQESITQATGGRVTDAPNDVKAAMTDGKLAAELDNGGVGAQSVTIGIEFFFEQFGAPTLTFTGSHACTTTTADLDFRAAPMPFLDGHDWSNNIRSYQAFNNCFQRMWDDPGCTGLLRAFASTTADLMLARDRTECIDWS